MFAWSLIFLFPSYFSFRAIFSPLYINISKTAPLTIILCRLFFVSSYFLYKILPPTYFSFVDSPSASPWTNSSFKACWINVFILEMWCAPCGRNELFIYSKDWKCLIINNLIFWLPNIYNFWKLYQYCVIILFEKL